MRSLLERLGGKVAEADESRTPPNPPVPAAGPFRREFWRSPLRGQWLTSFLGSILLPLVIVGALTGFLSHAAYNPALGSNDVSGGFEVDLYFFDWPTGPAWLYSLTQSLHVIAGFAAIPILLAKLWSVIPRLFERPSARSVAHGLERLSVLLLVGSALFLFVTGVINIQYWLPFGFSFVPAHYYAALIFVAALALHLVLKLPIVARTFRRDGTFRPLGEGIERMRAADPAVDDLAPVDPAAPTISRRGLLGAVGLGSLGLVTMTLGSNLLSPLREIALLSPRGQSYGDGPNDFQVNKTAALVGIEPADRPVMAARTDRRRPGRRPQPRRPAGDAAARGAAADRLRRGLDDLAGLVGRPARRSRRPAGVDRERRRGARRIAPGRRRLRSGDPGRQPDLGPAVAARAARQRRRPLSRPRLPGPGDRPGAAGRPQHEVGQADDLQPLMRDRFRYEYGAQPLHLIAVVASLLLCGYALLRITEIPSGGRVLIWLVAAALLHDLVALPLYSGLFRLTHGAAAKAIPDRAAMLMALNHVRVPAALSLLLLVVYAPLILRFDPDRYMGTTGLSLDLYLGRWLLISAGLFLISGLVYAVRLRRGSGTSETSPRTAQRPRPRPASRSAACSAPPAGSCWR